jgi:phosphomannomutase
MDPTLAQIARRWMATDPDPATREEIAQLLAAQDESGLTERFGNTLTFGTAGLRGILGAGPNRMNRAVVIRVTAGLARHLLDTVPDARSRGVVVGFDGRRGSEAFARDVAEVLAGANIVALCLPPRSPTPLCAFAVRSLGAAAGVMVTASHNPPEYNGYKIYSARGSQIVSPEDQSIAAAIAAVEDPSQVPRGTLVRALDASIEQRYIDAVRAVASCRPQGEDLEIAYTPLHGVGDRLACRTLAAAGFSRVESVAAQREPDPTFPTVAFPNPEEPGAMDLVMALGRERRADIVLANDPDADRLAAAVRNRSGRLAVLNGNELGVLLGHHLLTTGSGGPERLVITTIVSSPLLGVIARDLGVQYAETLTGFKWIADRALALEAEGLSFVFGYEEALGYACGRTCWDKDGISAAAVFAQLAARCKHEGRTVHEYLESIYRRHGLFVSKQESVWMRGADGPDRIAHLMETMRRAHLETIGPHRVLARVDYLARTRTSRDGSAAEVPLPSANVLAFELEGNGRITMRPSGTEPKVKYYFDLRVEVAPGEALSVALASGQARLDALVSAFGAVVSRESR